MPQHVNATPMNAVQRKQFAADLRRDATLQAQADTVDPAAAVDMLLWVADRYDPLPVLLNDDTTVMLDPNGDDHIVTKFRTDKHGFEAEAMLAYGTFAWQTAVERAQHAVAFK